jgi:hypothetical protein
MIIYTIARLNTLYIYIYIYISKHFLLTKKLNKILKT